MEITCYYTIVLCTALLHYYKFVPCREKKPSKGGSERLEALYGAESHPVHRTSACDLNFMFSTEQFPSKSVHQCITWRKCLIILFPYPPARPLSAIACPPLPVRQIPLPLPLPLSNPPHDIPSGTVT